MSTAADIRRRLLVWRLAIQGHARRVRHGAFARESLAQDLEHMAEEARELAVALLGLDVAGVPSDGPASVEADELADTQPILPLKPKG